MRAGFEIDVADLIADGFDPVMRQEDLLGFIHHEPSAAVRGYIERAHLADAMVLIFPIYWEFAPAMIKGFVDKILCPGAFYEQKSPIKMSHLMPNLRHIFMLSTMNTPNLAYRFIYGNTLKYALVNGTFKKLGFKNVVWKNHSTVKFISPKPAKNGFLEAENLLSRVWGTLRKFGCKFAVKIYKIFLKNCGLNLPKKPSRP